MNILFLSTYYPYPADSGHYLRTFNVLKILAEQHTIHFISFTKKKGSFTENDPIRTFCKSVDIFTIPDDFSKVRLVMSLAANLFSSYPYIAQKYYRTDMRKQVLACIKENNIDLVHIDLLHLANYVNDVGLIPKTLTQHNVESQRLLSLAENSNNMFFKVYMRNQYKRLYRFEKTVCPKFDLCITVSKEDSAALRHMAPQARFVEIPNGVDTEYFNTTTTKPEPNTLIWTGGMKDFYNRQAVDFFCNEIFGKIKKEIKDVKFIVIGSGPPASLVSLAASNQNIKILGYVDDIRPYMQSSAVFVAPMTSGGGTKLKVLNALSMGMPVVTTTVGAEGIEVENGRNIVIADDPALFARKTVELLTCPEKAAELGKEGRKLMLEKYDWRVIGKKHTSAYEALIHNTAGE